MRNASIFSKKVSWLVTLIAGVVTCIVGWIVYMLIVFLVGGLILGAGVFF